MLLISHATQNFTDHILYRFQIEKMSHRNSSYGNHSAPFAILAKLFLSIHLRCNMFDMIATYKWQQMLSAMKTEGGKEPPRPVDILI